MKTNLGHDLLQLATRVVALSFLIAAAGPLTTRYSLVPYNRIAQQVGSKIDSASLPADEKQQLQSLFGTLRGVRDAENRIDGNLSLRALGLGGLLSVLVLAGLLTKKSPGQSPG